MRTLLKAELLLFLNLFRVKEGRRQLVVFALTLVYFSLICSWIAERFLNNDAVREQLTPGNAPLYYPVLSSFVLVLITPLILMSGLRAGSKLVFSGGEVDFLMVSPAPRLALLVRAWQRLVFLDAIWAFALSLPFMAFFIEEFQLPWWSYIYVFIGCLVFVLPILAILIGVKVILMRWFSGPRLQLAFAVMAGLFFAAAVSVVALGLISGTEWIEKIQKWLLTWSMEGNRFPVVWDVPGSIIALGARLPLDSYRWTGLIVLMAAGPGLLIFASTLYLRALENERIASDTLLRRRTTKKHTTPWPERIGESLWKKDVAMTLRQPVKVLGIVFMTFVMVLLSNSFGLPEMFHPEEHMDAAVLKTSRTAKVPDDLRQTVAMLALFAWIAMMTLPGLILGVTTGEKDHWHLLACSPQTSRSILRGKLLFPMANLAYFAAVAMLIGIGFFSVSPGAILGFGVLSLPIIYGVMGVAAAIATIPQLAVPTGRGEMGHAVRSVFVAVLVMGAVAMMAMPGLQIWDEIRAYFDSGRGPLSDLPQQAIRPALLTLVVAFGAVAGWLGHRIAKRNFDILLGPASE